MELLPESLQCSLTDPNAIQSTSFLRAARLRIGMRISQVSTAAGREMVVRSESAEGDQRGHTNNANKTTSDSPDDGSNIGLQCCTVSHLGKYSTYTQQHPLTPPTSSSGGLAVPLTPAVGIAEGINVLVTTTTLPCVFVLVKTV